MTTAKILVTGGSGYVGRATIKLLKERGLDVVSIDKFNDHDDPNLIVADLASETLNLTEILGSSVKAVIHLAALKSIPESIKHPGVYFTNNVRSSLNVIGYCAEHSIPMVNASSAAVYFRQNPYADSKLYVEETLYNSPVSHINLRYFNIGGLIEPPTERQTGNIFDVIRDVYKADETFYINASTGPRDYSHVEDVALYNVEALRLVMDSYKADTIDVFSGNEYYPMELVNEYKRLGVEIKYELQSSEAEMRHTPMEHPVLFIPPTKTLEDIVRSEVLHGIQPDSL